MKAQFYAVFNRKGFVRATSGRHGRQPALAEGERAVRLQVSIPDAVFSPTGIPTANVDVPEAAVRFPMPEPVVAVMPAEEARP
jgi:hypothetical protein